LNSQELELLLLDLESSRVERKEAANDSEKIQQAICAFANDLPGSGLPGYLFVGVTDDSHAAGTLIDDRLLLKLSQMKDSGNILPLPSMTVERILLQGSLVAVVEVKPSSTPPVRYKGQVWIRVGPRRAIATREEELRLTERDTAATLTFDRRPCVAATLDDLEVGSFRADYLPRVVDAAVLEENNRPIKYQLASLRFFDLRRDVPTHAGVVVFGKDPLSFVPGSYLHFTRYNGHDRAAAVSDHKDIRGRLKEQLLGLDAVLSAQIQQPVVFGGGLTHKERPEYPLAALREFVLNAIMHRTYQDTSMPVRIYWFSDRVEILSPGGLYGQVTPENFEVVSDYRNPVLGEVMKSLGYVERFGIGIARAQSALKKNGNPPAQFTFDPTYVQVIVFGVVSDVDIASKGNPTPTDTIGVPRPGQLESKIQLDVERDVEDSNQ
jgi:ATP-dependent DNA helicase RecG